MRGFGPLPPRPEVIEVPTPPGPHPASTNCYAFIGETGGVDLVDPGWDHPDAMAALEAGLAPFHRTIEDVQSVVATHWHVDHLSLAQRVRERSGARIVLGRADVDEAGIEIDQPVDGGEDVRLGRHPARIIATPGHTPGSIAVQLTTGVLLTGDTVLADINPGVGLSARVDGNPVRDYLETLAGIAEAFPDATGLAGHGRVIHDLPSRCRELAAHHRARTEQVAAVLAEHPGATAEEVAPHLTWTGGWASLHGITLMSALRQTAWHMELVA